MPKAVAKKIPQDPSLPKTSKNTKAQGERGRGNPNPPPKTTNITSEDSKSTISTVGSGTGKNSGRMKVVIRIRPLNKNEKQSKANSTTTIQANDDEKTLQIYNADGKITVMSFDRVAGESRDQNIFFEFSNVTDLIGQALRGFATTVFAFGQTGSGKTYTITGPAEDTPSPDTVGLVPRALDFMFQEVERQKSSKEIQNIRIQASYMEIYNENVLDLLNPQNSGLPVRWSPERGFFVEHLYIVDCDSLDDCLAVLEEGLRNRTTAAHEMNEHSSRSHSMLTIYLEIEGLDEDQEPQHRYGKINFVDLAGSEKVKESRTTLDTFAEALSINKSLLTLGKCITALADSKKRGGHIPFRDSKLTKLLADSLSGRGLALMIACISPAYQNLNETLKTVRYAMQARKIQNRPMIQLDPQDEMVANFKMEILLLKKENTKLKLVLQKDPKYLDLLKLISVETEEYQKSMKSRPGSPIMLKAKPVINYRDRVNSSIPSLPGIINRSRTKSKGPKSVAGHSRSATAVSTFGASPKKALPNALPARLTEAKRAKTPLPKSAAKQRIEELKRSDAPAGHEPVQSRRKSISESQKQEAKKAKSLNTKSVQDSTKKKIPASLDESFSSVKEAPRTTTPHPSKITKRPSAIEHVPKLEKKPFPDHPHQRDGSNPKKAKAPTSSSPALIPDRAHQRDGSNQNPKKANAPSPALNHKSRSRETSNNSAGPGKSRQSSKKNDNISHSPAAKKKMDTLKEIEEMEREIELLKRERDHSKVKNEKLKSRVKKAS